MSATGTAARVNLTYDPSQTRSCTAQPLTVPENKSQSDKEREKKLYVDVNLANSAAQCRMPVVYDGYVVHFIGKEGVLAILKFVTLSIDIYP